MGYRAGSQLFHFGQLLFIILMSHSTVCHHTTSMHLKNEPSGYNISVCSDVLYISICLLTYLLPNLDYGSFFY